MMNQLEQQTCSTPNNIFPKNSKRYKQKNPQQRGSSRLSQGSNTRDRAREKDF